MILEKIERRPKVKAFGDIGPFRGQAAGWTTAGEDEAGDGRNEEPLRGLPNDLRNIVITHQSIRRII
jgi:hypothetical protein